MRRSVFWAILLAGIASFARPVNAGSQEVNSFEIVQQMGHTDEVLAVALSPDGRTALSASTDRTLTLWDLATRKKLRSFTGHGGDVSSVVFSSDGRFALAGVDTRFGPGEMKLWDVATGKEVRNFRGHEHPVYSVALSPDSRLALSGSADEMKLWDVASGTELRSFGSVEYLYPLSSVAFSRDSKYAISAIASKVSIWDLETGNLLRTFEGTGGAMAVSPDGRHFLSVNFDNLRQLKLWEIDTGREIRSFIGHNYSVVSVAFSADGRFVLSGSSDNTMKLWEVATGKELRTFVGHTATVRSVAISPDDRFALSGSRDVDGLKLWDVATGKELHRFGVAFGEVKSVALSRDGRFALSGGCQWSQINTCVRGFIRLWELSTGNLRRSYSVDAEKVESIAYSPDGRSALSGGWNRIRNKGDLTLWDLKTGLKAARL